MIPTCFLVLDECHCVTLFQEFQTSAALVERWSEQNSRFKQFLEAQETRPEVQLKLNALLITPVQRIPR